MKLVLTVNKQPVSVWGTKSPSSFSRTQLQAHDRLLFLATMLTSTTACFKAQTKQEEPGCTNLMWMCLLCMLNLSRSYSRFWRRRSHYDKLQHKLHSCQIVEFITHAISCRSLKNKYFPTVYLLIFQVCPFICVILFSQSVLSSLLKIYFSHLEKQSSCLRAKLLPTFLLSPTLHSTILIC